MKVRHFSEGPQIMQIWLGIDLSEIHVGKWRQCEILTCVQCHVWAYFEKLSVDLRFKAHYLVAMLQDKTSSQVCIFSLGLFAYENCRFRMCSIIFVRAANFNARVSPTLGER